MDARNFFPIAERYRRSADEAERRTSVGFSEGPRKTTENRSRKERNDADYRLNSTFNESRSSYAYMKASDALSQFDAIPTAEMESIVKIIQALP